MIHDSRAQPRTSHIKVTCSLPGDCCSSMGCSIEQDGTYTRITYSGSFIGLGVRYSSTSQITVVGVQVSDLHLENGDHEWS